MLGIFYLSCFDFMASFCKALCDSFCENGYRCKSILFLMHAVSVIPQYSGITLNPVMCSSL